ncbi:MAG: ABC transporter ATP-binding protein [candidate division WOR-3 bacterium]
MKAIQVQDLSFRYSGAELFQDFNLDVEQGEFLGIIGPNGAGKSTLLRLMSGLLRPARGRICLLGQDLACLSRREIARLCALVPQESFFTYDYTVREIVMMGRNPFLNRFARPGPKDWNKVSQALELADASQLADASINAISAGEKQRAILARALAQEPELLLLDEATSHLDMSHQLQMARILARLNRQGKTIVFLSHDLNLAALVCSRVLLLHQGKMLACGTSDQVITRELIQLAYGVEPLLARHPETGRPQVMLPGT